jgi:DNA repair photolyase
MYFPVKGIAYLFFMSDDGYIVKGRGAQKNSNNPFLKEAYGRFEEAGLDQADNFQLKTQIFQENPRKIVNKISSPDLGFNYSLNPYQGCEHGCVYCYARNTHHYWGYSAGLDFEQKIIVKMNASETLERQLKNPKWKVSPIMLSGNTDCYQPQERKLGLTRKILEVMLKYKHPVSIVTKNDLILRDEDILKELSLLNLVSVNMSINSLNENIRRKLEPRTTTYTARLKAIERLSSNSIPTNVLIAPVIPGLTSADIPDVMKMSSAAGARSASYILVRLNGAVADIFSDWVVKQFPDRAKKILNQVAACHGGQLNDSRFGRRMRGEGQVAELIRQLFAISKNKYFKEHEGLKLNISAFDANPTGQLKLF